MDEEVRLDLSLKELVVDPVHRAVDVGVLDARVLKRHLGRVERELVISLIFMTRLEGRAPGADDGDFSHGFFPFSSSLAMMRVWISEVPAPMSVMRTSR